MSFISRICSINRFKLFSLAILILISFSTYAQKINVKAQIDSSHIILGDPIKYSLQIEYNKDINVILPVFPDTFHGFVVIERSGIDSSLKNDIITRKQIITLTTFDSGNKVLPSLKINYQLKGQKNYNYILTDSFLIVVNYVPVDTTQAIKPIKAILKAPLSFREILPYLIISIVLALIIFAVYYYIKRLKSNKPLFVRVKPVIPPHIIALEKLKKLEDEKVWQKGEVKKFHIELTDIIREYMESRFGMLAVESTTPEIILQLKNFVNDQSIVDKVKEFLDLSDLVKFAKLIPLPDENEKCLKVSYEFIDNTKPDEPIQEESSVEPTETVK
jgi:hypothetical protein